MRDIPMHTGPAQQLANGGPRVHWLDEDQRVQDYDGALPASLRVIVREVFSRSTADGNGEVYVVFQLVEEIDTGEEGNRPEVVTLNSHDKILNHLIAEAEPMGSDVQAAVVHAYGEGIKTGRHGVVDDRQPPG